MSSQSQEYLLFAGDNYEPGGGWNDYVKTFQYLDEATSFQLGKLDWAHVVFDGEMVASYARFAGWMTQNDGD